MSEKLIRWEPVKELKGIYYLDSTADTASSFELVFSDAIDENKQLQVKFSSRVKGFRSTYETFRERSLLDFYKKYDKSVYQDWTFFKLANSEYLAWLSDQSQGESEKWNLTHYLFTTMEFILDIVHNEEPVVQWLF